VSGVKRTVVKIALVTETFPPEVNGVAMTLHRLATGLVGAGHQLEIIRPRQKSDDSPKPAATYGELLVPGLPLPGYAGLQFGLPAYFKLRRHWRTTRPEIVHIATEGPLGLSAFWAARSLGVTATSSFHTNFHAYSKHYGVGIFKSLGFAYLRWFHNQTAGTFVPSADLVETLTSAGFGNLRLLGRGVDTALFAPSRRDETLRASWGAGPETPVALCIGRLAAEKNLPLVVEAWMTLREQQPDLRLVLVGDGPMRRQLQARHPEIHFAGVRLGEDLARHYASGDLFLFPSSTETFGNVVTEALASGLVAVAYDYAAGRTHIRDGENGFLAPYHDRAGFHAAATRALTNRDRWPAMRTAARQTALGLSWGPIVTRFADTLAAAHAAAPRRPILLPTT
jgi:glycosyltransferase involved in cell wall biosynthesis